MVFGLLLLLSIIEFINCHCELNIGLNKFSAFFGKGIYYNGEIDNQFKENSTNQFISPHTNEIEYFYVAEKLEANTQNSSMVNSIISSIY